MWHGTGVHRDQLTTTLYSVFEVFRVIFDKIRRIQENYVAIQNLNWTGFEYEICWSTIAVYNLFIYFILFAYENKQYLKSNKYSKKSAMFPHIASKVTCLLPYL